MTPAARTRRAYFDVQTFRFLGELAANNNRGWFEQHKDRYERCVRTPALAFIEAMAPKLAAISIHFDAIAQRTGGSLMRVHRDARFSRDGSPYKTNIGIQFRHERGRDVHAPGFYVHIEPRSCFVGAGVWHPESSVLRAIRREIADHPKEWGSAIQSKRFKDHFELGGESLKRPPRGFEGDHPHVEDLKRKDFIAVATIEDRTVQEPRFVETVASLLRRASPLMEFLCGAVDLRY